MNYKPFGDLKLSCLGLGNMRLPVHADKPGAPIDYDRAEAMIDRAMAAGINYYDTAYVYHGGESEVFLGKALVSRYPRDAFYIATKFLIGANPDYKAVFEEQLARLQTDYIDFYLVHSVTDDTFDEYLASGCIAYFEEQMKKGRIRHLGFSSHASPAVLEKTVNLRKWDFAQIQCNYFDWCYGSAKAEYEILEKHNIPVIVMEPVRGGRLSALTPEAEEPLKAAHPDWSIATWALRFIQTLPQVQVVLSGMSNLSQLDDNIQTFSGDAGLNDSDRKILMWSCDAFHGQVQIPCTACRYCCDDCPAHINIPEVMRVYNKFKVDGAWALSELGRIDTEGKPSGCVACGACKGHCPQGIDVPAIMRHLQTLI